MKDKRKEIERAQESWLLEQINNKQNHGKLLRAADNKHIDINRSSYWLKFGNNSSKAEGLYCMLQDRNVLYDFSKKCNHCNIAIKTVDHLATQNDRMLYYDYKVRHDYILKSIHLSLAKKYSLTSMKRLKGYRVQNNLQNKNAEIRVDTTIRLDNKIKYNKPDIVVFDHKAKRITIVEIGVTSYNRLQEVEVHKKHKYDELAKELSCTYRYSCELYHLLLHGIV